MKRLLTLCLILAMLCCFPGCGEEKETSSVRTATFYYERSSYVYGTADGVIAPETREVAARLSELPYLLSLYLRGPVDEKLRSPFPSGCKLLNVTRDGSTLCVTLDPAFSTLKDMDLSIACACIARTCFSLADVTQVQIQSEAPEEADSVNVILSIDSLLLYDGSGLSQHPITEESQ